MLIEAPDQGGLGAQWRPDWVVSNVENALGQAGVVRLFDSMSVERIHN